MGSTGDIRNIKVPIIEAHKDQRLIIDFKKNEVGNAVIEISFEPDIPEVRLPAQAAAVNVANHIIKIFGLNRESEQNAESTETKQ